MKDMHYNTYAMLNHKVNNSIPHKTERIIQCVCKEYNLNRMDLNIRTNKRTIVTARYLCWYIISSFGYGLTLNELGNHFGNFDHSTIIHGKKTIQNLLVTDENIRGILQRVKRNLYN